MAILAVVHAQGVLKQNRTMIPPSDRIPLTKLNEMRNLFRGDPQGGYTIPSKEFMDLLNKTLIMKQDDYLTGLIVLPGKNETDKEFNIVLEPIFYKKPDTIVTEILPIKGEHYFGLTASKFILKAYEGTSGRIETRKLISRKDDLVGLSMPTHAILIDNKWIKNLQKFLEPAKNIDFVFGRDLNTKGLTMILLAALTDSIQYELYLDQHDLIPPPNPEALS